MVRGAHLVLFDSHASSLSASIYKETGRQCVPFVRTGRSHTCIAQARLEAGTSPPAYYPPPILGSAAFHLGTPIPHELMNGELMPLTLCELSVIVLPTPQEELCWSKFTSKLHVDRASTDTRHKQNTPYEQEYSLAGGRVTEEAPEHKGGLGAW